MNGPNETAIPTRSIVNLLVRYNIGTDKRGNPRQHEEIITLVVPHINNDAIQGHIQNYCSQKNMELIRWSLEGRLSDESNFEFTCENCNETSIDMSPASQRRFCSTFCRRARESI